MVRISRFASKYLTTAKKKPKKLKNTLNEDQLAAFIAGKPNKKFAKEFKKQTGTSKEIYEFDKVTVKKANTPTGYMTADLGKMKQRKAVNRSERLQMARYKNAKRRAK